MTNPNSIIKLISILKVTHDSDKQTPAEKLILGSAIYSALIKELFDVGYYRNRSIHDESVLGLKIELDETKDKDFISIV